MGIEVTTTATTNGSIRFSAEEELSDEPMDDSAAIVATTTTTTAAASAVVTESTLPNPCSTPLVKDVPHTESVVPPVLEQPETFHPLDLRYLAASKRQGFQFDIPTNDQAQNHVTERQGTDSAEHKVLRFLHQTWVQSTLAGLLLLDVIVLFAELALLTLYPQCHLIQRDAISCCPAATATEEEEHGRKLQQQLLFQPARMLAGSSSGEDYSHHDYCDNPDLVAYPELEAGCNEHKWHKVHTAEEVLFFTTMTILVIFLVELLVTMWAVKPGVFFRQVFYVLDFTIVSASIALEATFYILNDETLTAMIGLLILGRIWRFVRIGHGMVELITNLNHQQYKELLAYAEALEEELKVHQIDYTTTVALKKPVMASASGHHE